MDYASHFPPNLNPIPPTELMPEWERDYAELQGQMIVGEDVEFETLMKTVQETVGRISAKGQENIEIN